MKTSLKLMICERVFRCGYWMPKVWTRTFSCWMCFRSLSSRYVRFARTGVLKGFIIFFTATEEPVSWSFAELNTFHPNISHSDQLVDNAYVHLPDQPEGACRAPKRRNVSSAYSVLVIKCTNPFLLAEDRHNGW